MTTSKTIAKLRGRLAAETNPLERAELKRRIRDAARDLAAREYRGKAAAVRRDLAGAF